MADDDKELSLRDQVAAAFDAGGDDGAGTGDDAGGDRGVGTGLQDGGGRPSDDAGQRARDEQGRFAKAEAAKARETLSLKEKPETQVVPNSLKAADPSSAAAASPAPNGAAAPERIAAPTTWLGAAKTKWDRLPREVQQEIATREAQREAATGEAPIKELYDANREFLINQAGSVVEATRQMMQFARMTETVDGSIQLAQHILRSKGIDPSALLGGQQAQPAPGQQQPANVEVLLDRMLQQRLQPLQAQYEAQQQQQTQHTVAQVQAFMADPAHPYFNDVAPTIERLLSSGEIPQGDPMTRLKDAYERATWANSQIRSQLMAATTEEAGKRQAAEAEKARQAARTSLRGSPLPGAVSGGGKNSSVRDAVAQAWDEAAGA